jgi:Putative zinc-finger
MDHNVAVREKMTEKYLLNELGAEVRDEFEEHFFDCAECAADVGAAHEFVQRSKVVLAEKPEASRVRSSRGDERQVSRGWFAWLRPAFAVPVMALLLVVVGYQNLVTVPRLTQAVNQPQVLAATTVNLLTYGSNASPLAIHEGESFLVNVIIPPGHNYSSYRVDLHNPAGGVESVAIPASADDTWPIRFSGPNRQRGTYKLSVYGVTPQGQDQQVGSGSFDLQIEK